ncbi:unnamed protein product [Symbiodinium natans]|uniref:Uncharacterized protein n=1 Tax=Symbiodinium natans TaxID=878477 RepID=A0A812LQN4_9DINO|nr:unnamed protein product [Symbiodinium natans]
MGSEEVLVADSMGSQVVAVHSSRADLALRKACQGRDIQATRSALARGAGLGADKSGRTALHYAAGVGFCEGVRELLEQGFDPNVVDGHGGRPVDEAEYWGAKAPGEQRRKACLECRDCLVSFHGRRCDPQARDDTASFLHRRRSLQDLVRRRDGLRAYMPWQDDLDQLDKRLSAPADTGAASSASPGPERHVSAACAANTGNNNAAPRQRLWGDVVNAYKDLSRKQVAKAETATATATATATEPLDPKHERVYL